LFKDFAVPSDPGYPFHMTARPIKHSLTLHGHRTSVSMEPAFWLALRDIAARRTVSINALASEIDSRRDADVGLASAIRVFVLTELQSRS
jgi:predicted DNA-binding ribbon-helix-helix protein